MFKIFNLIELIFKNGLRYSAKHRNGKRSRLTSSKRINENAGGMIEVESQLSKDLVLLLTLSASLALTLTFLLSSENLLQLLDVKDLYS
jgi:hypothetical protein